MQIPEKVKVVIIGAGSAGLSALRQVQKYTKDYLIIDHGPIGTKCARLGCMPSKVLITIANDFRRGLTLQKLAGENARPLRPDIPAVLRHVRQLRDHFANGMVKTTKKLAGDRLIISRAEIIAPDTVRIDNKIVKTDRIIIASGSTPKIPADWQLPENCLLTTENVFDREYLPRRIAVIGLGPIGLELGQALSRLGIEITDFEAAATIAGITDPEINTTAINIIKEQFPIYLENTPKLRYENNSITVQTPEVTVTVDAVLSAIGFAPNLFGIGIENLGLDPKQYKQIHNPGTMQLGDLPVFIAGDSAQCRPVLHEALDEGYIAGSNVASEKQKCFARRTAMKIVFTDPQIASIGQCPQQLSEADVPFITGEVDFSQQARAVLEQKNAGLLKLYAHEDSAKLLGAQLITPAGEHLAHLIAMAIQHRLTIFDALEMPYYHPTVQEGLRSALRNAAKKLTADKKPELSLCQSSAQPPLC